MKHSVNFGDINSWADWGLLPVRHPVITMPPLRPNLIELPGLSGEIDLSEAIRGYPLYDNRTGQLSFLMVDHLNRWRTVFSQIRRHLHGQQMRLVLEDYPDWYFMGRFAVDEHACDERHGTVVIGYNLEPYMYALQTTTEPWKWDPFSFVDGVIGNGLYTDESTDPPTVWQGAGAFVNVPLTDTAEPLEYDVAVSGDMPVSPVFTFGGAAGTIIITVGGSVNSFSGLPNTSFSIPGLVLYRGGWLYHGKAATVDAQGQTVDPSDLPTQTVSGDVIHITDAAAVAADEITVEILLEQTGSGTPSTSNVRPITVWEDVSVNVSPSSDPADGIDYVVSLEDASGQACQGVLNVTDGTLTVDWWSFTVDENSTLTAKANRTNTTRFGVDTDHDYMAIDGVTADASYIKCDRLPSQKAVYSSDVLGVSIPMNRSSAARYRFYVSIPKVAAADDTSIHAWLAENPLHIAYQLNDPVVISLTPTEVEMLLGVNYVRADAGDVTLTYRQSSGAYGTLTTEFRRGRL